jgi:Protein of unknown function (DUF3429)
MRASELISSKNTSNTPDQLMRWLGYGGLVPFVGLAALLWIVEIDLRPWLSIALTSYAALIATFLGGVHWGIAANMSLSTPTTASQRRFHLIWGITPSLIAWLGLIMPAYAGLPLISVLLLACYFVDRNKYPTAGLAAWLPMRLQLTVIAVLSCLIGAGAI